MAQHSRETLDFDEYATNHPADIPRWQIRRISLAMSHSDKVEAKIFEG